MDVGVSLQMINLTSVHGVEANKLTAEQTVLTR